MGEGTDIVLGKRWAYPDIASPEGRTWFLELLGKADVLVHGYRPGALDRMVSPTERAVVQPGLVEVAFNAYGWTGPWSGRRGFGSLVQYSSGLADEIQRWAREDPDRRVPINALGELVAADRPRHLPVEAIDFSTGHQVAAAVIAGLYQAYHDWEGIGVTPVARPYGGAAGRPEPLRGRAARADTASGRSVGGPDRRHPARTGATFAFPR